MDLLGSFCMMYVMVQGTVKVKDMLVRGGTWATVSGDGWVQRPL